MARSFNIVLYCAVVAIILPFATSWTHWQNGHLPKKIAKQVNLQDRTVEKFDLVNSILAITYKFKTNITEKINETQTYFKEMESQLNVNNIVQIDIVHQGIQKRNSTSYSDTSNEIMYSLTALLEFLDDPMDEDLEKDFYNQATTIPTHLENLFNGLLGRNDSNADIMDTLRYLNKCHGRKLQEQVQSITNFITTGFAVHLAYQQLKHSSQVTNYSLANFVVESSMNVTERLNEMVLECRTNEDNVTKEMSDIIKAHQFAKNPPSTSSEFNEIIADELQSYLEDKYDTKMWVVVVKTREFGYVYKQLSCILSSGFHHQVKVQDTVAAAISINKTDAPQLSSSASLFLKDFKFPFIKKNHVYNDTISSEIHQQLIEKHLNISLQLMRTQVDTEIIMARNLTKNETDLVIRISNDLPFMAFDTFDSQIYDDNLLVIFIPVRNSSYLPFSSLNKEHSTNCRWNSSPEHGPLRNDITDLYLSVERDSIKEGAYIILYCWTNSSSQRWEFVNDQLRNDNGKCLTAMTAEGQFLYQHNCNHNWTGQKWYRNGLQIVNGFGLCLVYSEKHEGYVTQDVCGLGDRQIHSQYWQDFHTDCTDKLKTRAGNNLNGYILLRMAGTKDYITASKNNVYLNPSNNEPGQYWLFNDGKMMNGNGNCLIFRDDSRRVEQVDCNNITTGHQLVYNENNQIMNEKGYCLTFDYEYDYDNCRDEIRQLWIPEGEPIDCVF